MRKGARANFIKFCEKHWAKIVLAVILIIGCAVRLVGIDETPSGINADEAYAGYEAWSMVNDGTDSYGYTNPVYFVSWGSGMNVLYSYLSMPAVKIFGLNAFSTRIMQAIFGCITLVLIYLILRKFIDQKKSLIILGLLAICPWHIMLSRWGLESDILPFCMTLGVFGFIYGLKKKPFLLLAALGFGLCLYSYAVAWVVIPFLLAGLVGYGFYTKQLSINKWSLSAAGVLVLLGLPLLLLILVDAGVIPEIRTGIISIPKLPVFGSGGYGRNVVGHIANFINIIFNVKPDGYNVLPGVGLFFLFSSPFVAYGIWFMGRRAWQDFREKKWSLELLLAIWFAAYVPIILFINDANPTRVNAVLLPIFIAMGLGILHLTRDGFGKRILPVLLAAYGVAFLGFWQVYQENRAWNFPLSTEPITFASEFSGNVYFDNINFAEVLIAVKPTIDAKTAVWDNPDKAPGGRYVTTLAIGRYKLVTPLENTLDTEGTYVINAGNWEFNEKLGGAGFEVVYENAEKKVWRWQIEKDQDL